VPARDFHRSLPGYAPTPVRELPAVAAELGLDAVLVKDESHRLGLPSFKVLGASWAVERALAEQPGVHTLVAASAGNHGRAVAHVAASRGLAARIYLPARAAQDRRDAIAGEGAEVVMVDGDYEDAVALAAAEGAKAGRLELADVGAGGPAEWVIEGYATLFEEAAEQAAFDLLLVPVGVGSLAAAAVRFAAPRGIRVVAVEPESAACLTASLAAGEPVAIPTPGTSMAGLDCAEVSPAAWPLLRDGIATTVTVSDAEAHAAMRELAAAGLAIGDSGAAPLAALRKLDLAGARRALLVATEGVTDPAGYRAVIG
jgi:diaminopropionate ammonia-lyase